MTHPLQTKLFRWIVPGVTLAKILYTAGLMGSTSAGAWDSRGHCVALKITSQENINHSLHHAIHFSGVCNVQQPYFSASCALPSSCCCSDFGSSASNISCLHLMGLRGRLSLCSLCSHLHARNTIQECVCLSYVPNCGVFATLPMHCC